MEEWRYINKCEHLYQVSNLGRAVLNSGGGVLMGYALYGTPMGDAGYAVMDVCHEADCSTEIDRGLSYLCGMEPGRPDEHGCGHWFCDAHLYATPKNVDGYLCNSCILKYDVVDDDEDEECS